MAAILSQGLTHVRMEPDEPGCTGGWIQTGLSGSEFWNLIKVAALYPEMVLNFRELVIPKLSWGMDQNEAGAPDIWARVVGCQMLLRLTVEWFGTGHTLPPGQHPNAIEFNQPFECGVVAGRRLTVGYVESPFLEDNPAQRLLVRLAETAECLSVYIHYASEIMETPRTVASLVHDQIRRLYCEVPIPQMVV